MKIKLITKKNIIATIISLIVFVIFAWMPIYNYASQDCFFEMMSFNENSREIQAEITYVYYNPFSNKNINGQRMFCNDITAKYENKVYRVTYYSPENTFGETITLYIDSNNEITYVTLFDSNEALSSSILLTLIYMVFVAGGVMFVCIFASALKQLNNPKEKDETKILSLDQHGNEYTNYDDYDDYEDFAEYAKYTEYHDNE